MFIEKRHHGIQHSRVERCGGTVIEIDGFSIDWLPLLR